MSMMPTRDATPAVTTISIGRPTTRPGGRDLRTVRIRMVFDARRVACRRPARAFGAAGAVMVCAGTLLGLGLLNAARVNANEGRASVIDREQRDRTAATSPRIRERVPATRPTAGVVGSQHVGRGSHAGRLNEVEAGSHIAVDRAVPSAIIDGKVVQLASARIPAERAAALTAGVDLMRTIPAAGEKSTPAVVRPPVASPVAKAARTRTVRMEVTAYCPCTKCCGPNAQGVTASGLPVSHNGGRFVAADTSVLPFRTKLAIPGYHAALPVEVIDRGGAIKGKRLDVYYPTHAEALEWGRRWVNVTVVAD